MATQADKCPACGEKITEMVFVTNLALTAEKNALINEFHTEKSPIRCNKCGDVLYRKCKAALVSENESISKKIESHLGAMPIVSIHSPLNWSYLVSGLVTAQSTTGTGIFSEFDASSADLWGAQATSYNRKLRAGEDICKKILRNEALKLGANAVLAADIDYAEVGGSRGMLMVCMTGTAVVLKNTEIMGEGVVKSLAVLNDLGARRDHLVQYRFALEA